MYFLSAMVFLLHICSAMSHRTPAWILRIPRAEGPPYLLQPFSVFGVSLREQVDTDGLRGTFPDSQAEGRLLKSLENGQVDGSLGGFSSQDLLLDSGLDPTKSSQ